MSKLTEIPEDWREVLEEIVAYENLENSEGLTQEEIEWAQEWLYADLSIHNSTDETEIDEENWKIEIKI
jgi:hypothetical protein